MSCSIALMLPCSLYARYPRHRLLHLLRGVGVVLQLAGEVLVVGGEVEVAVAAEVEEDDAPIARLAGGKRLVDGGADGVGGLGGGEDALRAGELERGLEDRVLVV